MHCCALQCQPSGAGCNPVLDSALPDLAKGSFTDSDDLVRDSRQTIAHIRVEAVRGREGAHL
jgi:hypothetical protein